MRHTTSRIRLLLLVLLLVATSAGAWVQLNLRDVGNPDADLELIANNAGCCGGNPSTIASPSITFRRESDGTADVGAMATQTAWLATFSLINGLPTSNATATDGGAVDFNTTGACTEDLAIDGVNNVYFFTNNDCGSGGLAFAAFAFDASGGIADCDILFDDSAGGGIVWSTTTPGNPNDDVGPSTFDIQEVMNQEVQHCFGFEHTPVAGLFNSSGHEVSGFFSGDFSLQASLFPFATGTIQGRTFEPDDVAAFTALYPSGAPNAGTITGSVTFQGGAAVKGAHVVAVPMGSPNTPLVGALSGVDQGQNGTGLFSIQGVPPGDYFVRVEPMIGTVNIFTVPGNTFFSAGDDVTSFAPEFWSGVNETDADAMPGASDAATVTVTDGGTTSGINIIVNTLAPFAQGGANDTHAMARVIGTNTFREVVDTTAATGTDVTDPPTCFDATPDFTAWYTFTAPANGTITVSTEGSAYDTGLAAFTGMPGTFVAVPGACNDDISTAGTTFNLQSMISFPATSGTAYSFIVGDVGFLAPPEFILVVNFAFQASANAAPVAVDDPLYVTGPNQALVIADACPDGAVASANNGLLCNDTDADGDVLMVNNSFTTQPANGSVMTLANGGFTYTPNLGFSGTDTFTYRATDGTTNSNVATVTITVAQCTRVFDNSSADNQFETTNNWNPDGVPGSGTAEVLCIGASFAGSDNFPVTHSAGVETINRLRHTSTMPFTFNGGTLSMTGASEIGAGGLVLTSGTVDVVQTLTINGPVDWQAGTLQGGGGNIDFMNGATLSTAGVKTVLAAAVFNRSGSTLTWTDGNINLNNNSFLINEGTFNIDNDDIINTSAGTGFFTNSNTINKTGSATTTRVGPDVTFTNQGGATVNVNAGIFNIVGSGTSNGAINVAMGATLGLNLGNFAPLAFDNNSGSSVTGAGGMVTGDDNVVNFNSGSSLTIDTVSLGAGTLTLNSSATANVPNFIYQANGQVNVFTPLNISASFTWSCGAFEGGDTITVSGPATLSDTACGNKVLNDPNLLNNLTTFTWTGGDIVIDGNSVFTNNGSFDIQTDADILAGGSLLVGAIMNPGTFSKSAGAGVTTVGVPYTSTNITESLSGTLSFGSTFTQNGPTSRLLLDGGSFSGSTFQINDGTIEGAGTIIGDVVNSGGTLRPGTIGGMGAGVINETGNNTQLIGGAYNAELGGTTPGNMVGNHDQLNATGVANLNGTLNVTLVDAFTPVVGNMFTILTATGGVNGTYSTINLPNVAPNEWQVQFNANDVTLVLLANAPPNALDDMYSTNEEVQLVVNAASGVLANDTDSTAMTVTTTPVMDVSNGTLMLNADGSFTYTPDLDFAGMDSFVYEVCDTEPLCSTATVTITVNGINDAPTFTGGPDVMVAEDAGAQTVAMWATAISPGGGADEAGQVLTFNVTNNTNPALFSVGPAVDGTSGDLTFTSAPDANGSADITVVLMDDGGTANGGVDTSGQQFFTINIAPVNDAPVANNDMFTVVENSMNNVLDVLPNDTDVDGDTLTVVNLSAPDMGGTAMTDGMTITYSPAAAFTGTETFTYDACDPSAACDTALVTVNVVANFPPNAVDDVANTNEDSFVDTNVLANDDDGGDGGTLSVVGFTQGAFGTVTDQGGGILRYTPNPDFNGMDSYTYDVSDTFSTDTGTVNVTVVAVNDAPSFTDAGDVTVAEDSGAQTVAGWASNIMPGPATATDEAGQALQFNVTANTNAALFSVQPAVNAMSGDLTFTPAADAFGSSDITVVLMDDGGTANGGVDTSASSTFTITVTNVNDPPVITAGPTSNPVSPIPGNTSTGANVAFSITVTDADNDPLTFSWTGGCGASAVEDPTLACPFGVGLSVDVTVDDGNGGMDMGNIVVDVTDYSIAANCTSGMPPCTSATMATITAGQAVDFDLTATGINGTYAANITYSCTGLPAQTTCSFSPSNMVANAPPGGVVTMLRIQTTAPGFAQLHAPSSQPSQPPFLALFMTVPGLALFGLVLAGGRRKRRGLGTLCLLAIALVMATVLVGCGSGGDFFTSLGNPGTPAGSHTIMIRAQGAGTLERTVDLTVVVQ